MISNETAEELKKYFAAAANLYGIIPLRKLLQIYNSQNEAISEEDFCAFADGLDDGYYAIVSPTDLYDDAPEIKPIDREVVAEYLLVCADLDDYEMTKDFAEGKPYYVPTKEKLLKWADDFYIEKTFQYLSLRTYLRNRKEFTRERADEIAEDLQQLIMTEQGELEFALSEAERYGVTFQNQIEFDHFYDLCIAISQNSRLHIHRGHTLREMLNK